MKKKKKSTSKRTKRASPTRTKSRVPDDHDHDHDRSIVLQRVFNAPREAVFEAWTDPKHLDAWMGPLGFQTTTSSMSFRVGGAWTYVMRHAQHGVFQNRVIYREIVVPERLVYLHDRGVDDDPSAFETTVTFEEQHGGRTLLTMRSVLSSATELERVKQFGAVEGGRQTLERLAQYLGA